jgi:cytochrome c
MMARLHALLGSAALLCTITTPAWANLELADKSACLNCHSVEKKMVGPSFADIAAKYKDRKDAAAYLTEKIVKGSSGAWGAIPMPANAQLKADDAKALSAWIMALPPKK